MKRIYLALLIMIIIGSCASTAKANPDEVSLNTAIREAAARMETRLPAGTKIALINFTSPSQAFSEYVLDELSSVLVNNGKLVVVDRANLDKIRQELGFNMSGEVSDKSMQEIGQMLGAQALVTGSLTSIADLRRVMFKAIMTETAAVTVQHPADIINDKRIQALLASGGGSRSVAYDSGNTRTGGNSNSGSGTTTSSTSATTTSNSRTTQSTATTTTTAQYKIGDTGPAGGLIFYDKGNSIGGWRYLEAAPRDLGPTIYHSEDSLLPNYAKYVDPAGRPVGRGKYNTEYIMEEARNKGGGFNWAAKLCDDYELNGFNDWFLPSRDELNHMYGNLHLREKGNFRAEKYWSSTTNDNG
jgi:TolB-like protein